MKHTHKPIRVEKKLDANLQYTFVTTIGNSVYARARTSDGAPVYTETKYTPVYYLPTDEDSADARGYDDAPLMSVMCDSLNDARPFLEEHPDAYGNIQPEYMMLSDVYGDKDVAFDVDRLYVWDIDIEVDRDEERGFSPVEDPFNPIITISVLWWHMGKSGTIVYGTKPYTVQGDETYVHCADEADMLRTFLADFKGGGDYPDIITGWNVNGYDMPYLVNRMKTMFGEDVWTGLSPFGRIYDKKALFYGQEYLNVDIRGITILDYYELYRKFTLSQQERYTLDHIAHIVLKKRKVSYAEHRSLDQLYRKDYQKFIEYNITDVKLVAEIDGKMKLIELVAALAYTAKSNFADTFKQVRLWDVMVYHKLRSLNQQIPPRKQETKTEQYAGAFVKDPIVGMHEWVVSFDVASMYPHIIREWNLSPEMLIDRIKVGSVEEFLTRKVDVQSIIQPYGDVSLAVNGALTRKDKEGFLPNMLKSLYDERNRFKKLMNKAKDALEHETDPEKRKQLEKDKAAFNNQQAVRKVNLNSAYGALGSAYFRFYDVRLAEAVTITGQLAIRWVAQDINAFINKTCNTKNVDYIIASDTDSVYINMKGVAERMRRGSATANPSTADMVEHMNKFGQKFIQPLIDKSFVELAEYLNVYLPCLSMVRDVIADKAIWTAKKRYIMNVHDSEGVRFKTPDLKMMGIEAIKSSTPAICRKMITDALKLMMTGSQADVWSYIAKCRDEFHKSPFEDVAFPRSVKGLKKYAHAMSGVPIHVRGALAYNGMLEKQGLTMQFAPIHEGEKIKFVHLREPNPFHSHVLSAPGGCPPEWKVEQWIDYEKQFAKTFIEPVDVILKCAGWTVEHEPSLFD